MGNIINVGFIGNPNCGKTTLFNAFTGANLKVANWPGVTVEKKEGKAMYKNQEFKLIDLPGIYSLTSYTMEETVSRECIMSDEVDVIVDVIDASSLERVTKMEISAVHSALFWPVWVLRWALATYGCSHIVWASSEGRHSWSLISFLSACSA